SLVARPDSCCTAQMTRWSRRRDSDSAAVPPVPGPLGLPAVPAGRPARRRAAPLARTLRTRWWPRFLLAGLLLVIIRATLLTRPAAAGVGISGVAVIIVAILRAASMTADEYRREPPVGPGSFWGGGSFGGGGALHMRANP